MSLIVGFERLEFKTLLLLKKYCIAFEKVLAPSDLIVSIQLNMQCNSGINKSSKNFELSL